MTLANSLSKAKRLERDGRPDDAAAIYGDILSKFPKNAKAKTALDTLSHRVREASEPPADVRQKLAQALAANKFDAVITAASQLVKNYRGSHSLWMMLGRAYLNTSQLDKANTCLAQARSIDPKSADTEVALGDVYKAMAKIDIALGHYDRALALDGRNLGALNNKGNLMLALGRKAEAAALLQQAAAIAPDNPQILFNQANILRELGQMAQAQATYEKVVALAPALTAAQFNLGLIQVQQEDRAAAVQSFEAVLEKTPADDRARVQKLHMMAHLNDWRWITEYQDHRKQLGLRGIGCSPFALMTMEDNPDLLRLRTQGFAGEHFTAAMPVAPTPVSGRERIRIGYFSADFHAHATMHLMGGLFEQHDADKFEIFAYSYGPNRDDAARKRVQDHVACFRDVSALGDAQLIELARADELDIAVDLKGYTGDNRCSVFANRLAPIQMAYLGYPGTMGTPAYDYMIADSVVCPPGSERYYSEHLIRLPNCYQVNDGNRAISDTPMTRADHGLPADGFVFCSFNNSYKITPREFDIWMRLLTKVDGSVLWLLDTGETSKENLRREAEARGVDPARLIFAARAPQDEHLARQRLADLFLDTFTVNAHTTASDALWAGLPTLTLAGTQFAARVCASLLTTIGLPELITQSEADYEALALQLAQNPDELKSLKGKLDGNRLTSPLFNTTAFARDLEQGFDMAVQRMRQGQSADHLTVPSAGSR